MNEKTNAWIQVRELSRTFTNGEVETRALRGITFEMVPGEFLAVTGPSGGGKSTLLHILGLRDRGTGGSVRLLDRELATLGNRERTLLRRKLGCIDQNAGLVGELSVYENVELPLVFLGMKRKERRKRVEELLDRLKLSHRLHHRPAQLSGGQQQRIAFARAIASRPELLLADEPTGNLDSANRVLLMDLLSDFNRQGGSIVMVTHSAKDASYAHRILHLNDGSLLSENQAQHLHP
ncbi:MAG: ABC transporter ATP-binding protein [Bacteroidales bacterium]